MPRHPRQLKLTEEDLRTLEARTRSRTINNAAAIRARIILATYERRPAAEIAESLGLSPRRVYKWIWRFDKEGIKGLDERPRSGRPRKLDNSTSIRPWKYSPKPSRKILLARRTGVCA